MDWVVDSQDTEGVRALRREVTSYLRRHALESDAIGDAELAVSELITNVGRHASGPVWLTVDWSDAQPVVRVADVGPGFDLTIEAPDPTSITGRGLVIVHAIATKLEAHRRAAGGSIVSVTLPLRRAPAVSIDPPRRRTALLPALDEADPDGGFGKEAFLRALVVQLAHTVAEQNGPDAAEQVVAQVGTDVGSQMEAEYRLATDAIGRLDADQLAHCFVRLKHAIDGGFSIVEVTPNRIVLDNDRCPFGDVVRQAPALCRMTSSVFGGIAARNSDHGATVHLEERIAIGDVRCRVVIELDPVTGPDHVSTGHQYRTPTFG